MYGSWSGLLVLRVRSSSSMRHKAPPGSTVRYFVEKMPETEELRRFQGTADLMLSAAAAWPGQDVDVVLFSGGGRPDRVRHHFVGNAQGVAVVVNGPFSDLALGRLESLIGESVVTERLRRCPECLTLFLRQRRQLYCCQPCKSRVNARRRRPLTHKQRMRRSQRARERYAQIVQHRQAERHAPAQRRPRAHPAKLGGKTSALTTNRP
jgi:hypothetical protein